jgi:hypothetical protein
MLTILAFRPIQTDSRLLARRTLVEGADEGTRTLNLRITNPPLYQLSYVSLGTEREGLYDPSRARASL